MADEHPDIAIRRADNADVDALSEIGVATFQATYAHSSSAADIAAHLDANFRSAAVRREIALPGCTYLIASVDGEPAGFAKFRKNGCPAVVPADDSIELQQLYVAPEKQGYGIGQRLVSAVIDIAQSDSVGSIWLSTWQHADWAIGFYRGIGFAEVGTTDFRVGETVHTDLLLWLPVGTRR